VLGNGFLGSDSTSINVPMAVVCPLIPINLARPPIRLDPSSTDETDPAAHRQMDGFELYPPGSTRPQLDDPPPAVAQDGPHLPLLPLLPLLALVELFILMLTPQCRRLCMSTVRSR
jgi:hypothetical protein